MITVVRTPTYPWRSLDALNELYINIEFPHPTNEEVDCCMNCPYAACTNCKDTNRKARSTGKKRGRPRKDANITITGQITISM